MVAGVRPAPLRLVVLAQHERLPAPADLLPIEAAEWPEGGTLARFEAYVASVLETLRR